MKVQLVYFSVKEQQLELAIQRDEGQSAIPIWMTFGDFQYLIHRLREIEGFLLTGDNKEV